MRKGEKILAVLLLVLTLGSVTVSADEKELWTPDDLFYIEHAEDCIPNERSYLANGPDGQVILYESPASCQVKNTLENGEITPIDYIYTNAQGIEWGFCEVEGITGWLPMPYMVLSYDYLSFEEDYGDQILEESGKPLLLSYDKDDGDLVELMNIALEYLESNKRIRFWKYPGSSESYAISGTNNDTGIPTYKKTFVDEDGRKWGFVGFFRGEVLNRWICISSVKELIAEYEELYPNGAPKRDNRVIEVCKEEIYPDDYEDVQKMQKTRKITMIGGICLVLVIFGVFYGTMWKKWKQA